MLSKGSSSPCRASHVLSPTAHDEENIARNPTVGVGLGGSEFSGLKKPETFVSCVHEWLPRLLTEARSEGVTPAGPNSTCFHGAVTGLWLLPLPPGSLFFSSAACFPAWKLYPGTKALHTFYNPFHSMEVWGKGPLNSILDEINVFSRTWEEKSENASRFLIVGFICAQLTEFTCVLPKNTVHQDGLTTCK